MHTFKPGDILVWHRASGDVICDVDVVSGPLVGFRVRGWLGHHWENANQQRFELLSTFEAKLRDAKASGISARGKDRTNPYDKRAQSALWATWDRYAHPPGKHRVRRRAASVA